MITIQDYDTYCFDLDGTIYVADKLLPGVGKTLEYIRNQGKKVRFITNSSTLTREECMKRLQRFGLSVYLDEVVTALYMTGLYFNENASTARVLLVGDNEIKNELHRHAIMTTEDPKEATHVLVGCDREFSYEKIQHSMDALLNGAKFIVINPDPVCPVKEGYIPDTMSLAKSIEVASGKPINQIIGKPSIYYGNKLMNISQVDSDLCLVIGDRLETDIQLGKQNGFATCLVMTGVAKKQDVRDSLIKPDFIVENMSQLFNIESSLYESIF